MRSWKIQAKNTFPFRPNAWIFQGEHLGYVSPISPSVNVYVLFLNLEIEILYLEFLQDMIRFHLIFAWNIMYVLGLVQLLILLTLLWQWDMT